MSLTATLPSQPATEPAAGRLAAVVHDGVAQDLLAARLTLDEIMATADVPPAVRDRLAHLSHRLAESSSSLRLELHRWGRPLPPAVDPARVVDRVQSCVREFMSRHEIISEVSVSGSGPEPAPAMGDLLVRSVREGLANVAKHADASEVHVAVRRGSNRWTVDVEDDGAGRPSDAYTHAVRPDGLSFGLFSLADQAARLAGDLTIRRARRLGGFALRVTVPSGRQ